MPIEFLPADMVDFTALTDAFNLAYSDYLVRFHLTPAHLQASNDQTDTLYPASAVAVANGKIVGMGFLAIRRTTGWIGGMGIIPDYRRQGIGHQIMKSLLQNAGNSGADTVLLEVIEGNAPARGLYESLGFRPIRRLLIVQGTINEAPDSEIEVQTVSSADALIHYDAFHTVRNPWQRTYDSLRKANDLTGWIASVNDQPLAYMIGRITKYMIQIMDAAYTSQNAHALQALFSHISQQQPGTPASMVNLAEDDSVWPIMHTIGFEEKLAQIEMQITL